MGELFSPKVAILLVMVVAYIIIFPLIVMRKGKKNNEEIPDEAAADGNVPENSGKGNKKNR